MSPIPYARQDLNQNDIDAVAEVLESDWLTQGPTIEKFEQKVASYCDVAYGVAVCNATAGLHLACLALDLGPGDWLWTSPNTFVSSANAALYCGAEIDFVDIDPKTYNLCPQALEQKLIEAEKENKLPKIVVPVHFAGQSCEMKTIWRLSQKYGFKIIEDAAHAIGGTYQQGKIGSCQYSDITVFSFHPVKIITTGEGGMVMTRDKTIYENLKRRRSLGITRDPHQMTQSPPGPWYYEQLDLGFNYRMTDIQAALGISQMIRLDEFVSRRHQLAKQYEQVLKHPLITLPYVIPEIYSSYHLYVIRIDYTRSRRKQNEAFNYMREKNIFPNLHYIPVHTQPYYQNLGFRWGDFPEAEKYYHEAMSLPLFPKLSDQDQKAVAKCLLEAIE